MNLNENFQLFMAGFGFAAVVGLMPIVGFTWWFAKTYATTKTVEEGDSELSKRLDNSDTRLRLLELKQERQTAVLDHLTQAINQLNTNQAAVSGSINQLNITLQSLAGHRNGPIILPHNTSGGGENDR